MNTLFEEGALGTFSLLDLLTRATVATPCKHWATWALVAPAALLPAVLFVTCELLTLHTTLQISFLLEIGIFLWLAFYFVIAWLCAVLVFFPKSRSASSGALVFCVVSILAGWGGRWMAGEVRSSEMSRLAARSTPLVAAIRSFESDTGKPPKVLSDLVPRYLATVPGTGLGGYPIYSYEVDEKSKWTLMVDTPTSGIFNMDNLKYAPDRPIAKNEGITRYGDWIYVEYTD